jgi:hypothetical protein
MFLLFFQYTGDKTLQMDYYGSNAGKTKQALEPGWNPNGSGEQIRAGKEWVIAGNWDTIPEIWTENIAKSSVGSVPEEPKKK